jgi:hypothetical protein
MVIVVFASILEYWTVSMTVYKYMKPEIGELFLNNWSVAFSRPAYFNDPFDCHPGFVLQTEEEKAEKIEKMVRARSVSGFDEDERRHRSYAEYYVNWEERDSLAQYRDLITHGLFYVTSFTRTQKNVLMWSHYAKEHSGVLVGFCENSELLKGRVRPVVYSDERPRVQLFGNEVGIIADAEMRSIFVKGLDWAYEQESRVVLRQAEAVAYHREVDPVHPVKGDMPFLAKIKKSDVEVLVFGCRYRGDAKKIAQSLADDPATSHIKTYRSVPDLQEFKLNYVPI